MLMSADIFWGMADTCIYRISFLGCLVFPPGFKKSMVKILKKDTSYACNECMSVKRALYAWSNKKGIFKDSLQ